MNPVLASSVRAELRLPRSVNATVPAAATMPATPATGMPTAPASTLADRVARVVAIAAMHADSVDRTGSFPAEAVEALRREELLGAWLPVPAGGLGATLRDMTSACTALGTACASTGMIFAMHQIQVAVLLRHHCESAYVATYLRLLAREQRLIASGTSELGVGGDVRTSRCAVVNTGETVEIEKQSPVISYGLQAHDLLVTARRDENAALSDQVIVLLQRGEFFLEQTSTWDALGFRGTASHGFILRGTVPAAAILTPPFADVASETMVPVSHLLWSALWLGIATDAVRRARTSARAESRRQQSPVSHGSVRLAALVSTLHAMRATVNDAVEEFSGIMDDRDALGTLGYAIRINNLKLSTSDALVEIVQQAMRVAGISGYRLQSNVSLGRALRDALGAVIMISNDRIIAANAMMLLASRED